MNLSSLFLLLLIASANSIPTITLEYENGISFDSIVLYPDLSRFPGMFRCDVEADWELVPDLPAGLRWSPGPNVALIVGTPTEITPETKYTVTVTSKNGTASMVFTMEVAHCDSNNLYFFSTDNEVTLSNKGKKISVYIRMWRCLEPVIYDYYIPYIEWHQTVSIWNKSETTFLSVISESNPKSGKLDLSNSLSPQIFASTDTVVGTSSSRTDIHFSVVNPFTSLSLYPPLDGVVVDNTLVKIKLKHHYERDHYVVVSNEHGSSSVLIHILWDKCTQFSYFSYHHYPDGGELSITNKNNETVELLEGHCTKETEMFFTASHGSNLEWNIKYPLILYDENGIFGEVFFSSIPSTISFRFAVLVPDLSAIKYSYNVDNSWMNENYDDSSWMVKQQVFCGSFEKDIIYFRKEFNVESTDGYNVMMFDILGWGFARVYLNGEEVEVLQVQSSYYSRLEIPVNKLKTGTNVVGVSFEKTEYSDVIFDLSIRLVTLSEWIQSLTGKVTEYQDYPTGHPDEAFAQETSGSWKIQSYPATLEIDFYSRKVIANRFFIQHYTCNADTIKAIRLEGVDGDETVNLYETQENSVMNEYTHYRLIDFENSRGFPIYRITFLSNKSNSTVDISNIRLSRIMIPSCEKAWKRPETYPNHVVSKSCGIFYSGIKQMICKVEDYSSYWIEDKSLCLSKLPPQGNAYVDFTLRLINFDYHSYNETFRNTFRRMIIDNNAFVEKDMELLLVSDSSADGLMATNFMMRITVLRSGGDFIRDRLIELRSNLTSVVHAYFSESLDGEIVGDIRVFSSIDPTAFAWITLAIVVLIILQAIEFYMIIRSRRSPTKKKNLKDGLLANVDPFPVYYNK